MNPFVAHKMSESPFTGRSILFKLRAAYEAKGRIVGRVLACLVVAVLAASCTGEPTEQRVAATEESNSTTPEPTPDELCGYEVGPLVATLDEIDTRLDGQGYTALKFEDAVDEARELHKAMDVSAISPRCISDVATPARDAFNEYDAAAEGWDQCLTDRLEKALDLGITGCSERELDRLLQAGWARASQGVQEASANLDELVDP